MSEPLVFSVDKSASYVVARTRGGIRNIDGSFAENWGEIGRKNWRNFLRALERGALLKIGARSAENNFWRYADTREDLELTGFYRIHQLKPSVGTRVVWGITEDSSSLPRFV